MDISILQFFEGIRNPVLTAVLGVFSLLGEAAVISAIVILVFWLAPKKVGEQALVTVLTGYCLNSYMKYTAARPRPYVSGDVSKLDPPLGAALDEYASFPSGHAQMTSGLFASVMFTSKRVIVWLLSVLVVALIAVSRIYFGVHYPSDVFTGLFLGLLSAIFWALVYRVLYDWRHVFLLVFAALALIPLLFSPSHEYVRSAGLLAGAAIALPLLEFSSTGKSAKFPRRLWRIFVGLAILAPVFVLTMFFPEGVEYTFLTWLLLTFAGIFGGQLVFEQLQI